MADSLCVSLFIKVIKNDFFEHFGRLLTSFVRVVNWVPLTDIGIPQGLRLGIILCLKRDSCFIPRLAKVGINEFPQDPVSRCHVLTKFKMPGDTKVVYLDTDSKQKRQTALARLPAPVHAVHEKAKLLLAKALKGYFDRLDDALFEMADRAHNNEEQNLYFDSMREVRVQRRGLETRFAAAIDQAFAVLVNPALASPSEDPNGGSLKADALTLIHEDELEEVVAIDTSIARANSDYGESIQFLSLRLDSLLPVKVYQKNNPIGPDVVCTAFKDQAKRLDIDIKAKLVMFKLFDKLVVAELGDFYRAANDLLVEHNVLPSISVRSRQANSAASAGASSGDSPDIAPGAQHLGANGSMDAKPQVLSALAGILGGGEALAGGTQSSFGVASELLTLLSKAQQVAAPSLTTSVNVRALLQSLQQQHGMSRARIGRVDEEVINLVEMLFEFILEDRSLPATMKATLSRLQIPMVKVAILDKAFFTHSAHSARKLLNEMASAAVGWEEKPPAELAKDPLVKKMNQIVQRILADFDSDVSIFDELLADFTSFLANEKRRSEVLIKRTLDAEDGKAKAETGRAIVAAEIELRLIGRPLPKVVCDIADKGWTNYLFVTGLKHGYESSEWLEGLKTLEYLVWSATPPRTDHQRKELIKVVPILVKRVRIGLESISFNPFKLADMLKALEDVHLACISRDTDNFDSRFKVTTVGQTAEPASIHRDAGVADIRSSRNGASENRISEDKVSSNNVVAALSGKSVAQDAQEDVSQAQTVDISPQPEEPPRDFAQDDPQMQQVASFVQGAWFEMHDNEGHPQRCRFAAFIKPTGKYIFVSRGGMKVAEKTQQELALLIKRGKLRALDNSVLFDRALETIVAGLRKPESKPL